jgi:HlyD family secretion protein
VLVQEGDTVKAGQVIARMDCADQKALLAAAKADRKAAEAQVEAAEATYRGAQDNAAVAASQTAAAKAEEHATALEREQAARDAERTARLRASGAVSEAENERYSTQKQGIEARSRAAGANVRTAMLSAGAATRASLTAKAHIESAKASVEAAHAAQEKAQTAVDECTLVAPVTGVVTDRLLEPGAVVNPGARVVDLVDLSTAKLTFFLPDAELARARIDAPAEVKVDAFPGRVFNGRVRRVASEAEFTPRNVQTREDRDRLVYAVEVHVPNQDGTLRAGMPADVSLPGTGR